MSRSLNFQNLPREKQKKLAENRAESFWISLVLNFICALLTGYKLLLVVAIIFACILCVFGWNHYQRFGCFPYPWSDKNP